MTNVHRPREKQISATLTAALHLLALTILLIHQRPFETDLMPRKDPPSPINIRFLPPPRPPAEIVTDRDMPSSPSAREGLARRGAPPALDATPNSLSSAAAPSSATSQFHAEGDGAASGSGDDVGAGGTSGGQGEGSAARAVDTTLEGPRWIVQPTDAQMRAHTPYLAIRDRVSGRVLLRCRVNREQRAHQCRVAQESPDHYGFGIAALQLSRRFRIQPPVRNGQFQHDAWVRIPVLFESVD